MQQPIISGDYLVPLFEEIEKELDPFQAQIESITTNYCNTKAKKSQFDTLKFENDIIKEELETEERWMRRIANEALDSEENNLLVILKSLWYLSTKEPNCYDIIGSNEVIEILTNAVDTDLNSELTSTVFGIFGNLCQSNELRDLLFLNYTDISIKMIIKAKNIINSTIMSSKPLQMSLIFLYNFSPQESAAEQMAQNWIFEALSNVLLDHFDEPDLVDIAIRILSNLINNRKLKILMYLTNETMSEIYKSLTRITKTSISINLILSLKELFPSIESLTPESE
mgnify:CR=1 FL=1